MTSTTSILIAQTQKAAAQHMVHDHAAQASTDHGCCPDSAAEKQSQDGCPIGTDCSLCHALQFINSDEASPVAAQSPPPQFYPAFYRSHDPEGLWRPPLTV